MTIVSIRATHGGGKSTIVKKILDMYDGRPDEVQVPGKRNLTTLGYNVSLPDGTTLYVVGPYKTACGGCDAIQPYSEIWPRIALAHKKRKHVLFEGALVSSSYGNIGRSLERYGQEAVFAFLDTPLEECLRRVQERRTKRGDDRPLNPANTTSKFESVARTKEQMLRLGSALRAVDLDHKRPVQQVLKLFGVTIRKEPT